MAEQVGFEPTDPLGPLVFKTSAISQTLPLFLVFTLIWSDKKDLNLRISEVSALRLHQTWPLSVMSLSLLIVTILYVMFVCQPSIWLSDGVYQIGGLESSGKSERDKPSQSLVSIIFRNPLLLPIFESTSGVISSVG